MRVLLTHRPGGAFGYISDGWQNALRQCGHVVQRWDGQERSWRQFQPELYIGCSGHRQNIPTVRDRCKLAIHVNPHGPTNVDRVSESQESIDWVVSQLPDCVFGYGLQCHRNYWAYWEERLGIPWVPMATAGDRTIYELPDSSGRPWDVAYVGGRWAYKAQTLDRYLLPLLRSGRVSFRLHGWGEWFGLSSGEVPDDQFVGVLQSAKVSPCVSELHTHQHGIDMPERYYKAVLCGMLAVHDPVRNLNQSLREAIVARDPEEFQQLCSYYSRPEHERERAGLAERQRQEVLLGHTYHHRLHGLLAALGFQVEAQSLLEG